MISAMDTNGDGNISEAEFVAARPADVSDTQAQQLFQKFDTKNTGSLTEAQLAQVMRAGHHGHHAPARGQMSDDELAAAFSSMDKDGDGSVSQSEFVAARPSDVSEDQATSLFKSLDPSGSGSLTQSQFEQAMKAQQPQTPDFGSFYSNNEQDSTTSDLLTL
jgi:Ca2+-binding EF-hand superfamily protein